MESEKWGLFDFPALGAEKLKMGKAGRGGVVKGDQQFFSVCPIRVD